MKLFKADLHHNYKRIVAQMCGAIIYVMIVLVCMDMAATSQVLWAVGSSSLASSAYLVFSLPSSHASQPSRILGGFVIGAVSGFLVHSIAMWLVAASGGSTHTMLLDISSDTHMYWIIGAFAVGLSMILMVIFDFEHPPAAGMSLALVLELKHYTAILVIMALALLLCLIRYIFRHQLRDLS